MHCCCIKKCVNRSAKKSKKQILVEKKIGKITFHGFPKDAERRERWIKAIQKPNWTPTRSSYICSVHFERECFSVTKKLTRLEYIAVPTLFVEYPTNITTCATTTTTTTTTKTTTVKKESEVEIDISNLNMDQGPEITTDPLLLPQDQYDTSAISKPIEILDSNDIKIEHNDVQKLEEDIDEENSTSEEIDDSVPYNFQDILSNVIDDSNPDDISNTNEFIQENTVENDSTINLQTPKQYCRLCAKLCQDKFLISLFDHDVGSGYLDLLAIIMPGVIKKTDKLPHTICTTCGSKLNYFKFFFKGFMKANVELEKLFNIDKNLKEQTSLNQQDLNVEIEEKQNLDDSSSDEDTDEETTEEDPYICILCEMKFTKKLVLKNHTRNCHTNINKMIESEKSPNTSLNAEVSVSKPIHCFKCSDVFTDINTFRNHMAVHVLNNNFTCTICKSNFKTRTNLLKHKRTHKIPKSIHTKEDKRKTIKKPTAAVDTIESDLEETTKELDPGDNVHNLIDHDYAMEINHDDDDVQSDNETKKKKQKNELKNNKNLKEVKQSPEYSCLCSICGKIFASFKTLYTHQVVHTNERRYRCTLCSKSFKTAGHLAKHRYSHNATRHFMCQICGKQYQSPGSLQKHSLSHALEKPHYCDLCGAGFMYPAFLRKHRLKHDKDEVHLMNKCRICLLDMSSYAALRVHMNVEHVGEKPYACKICNRQFMVKEYYEIHKRLHTGECPYRCEVCDKTFRSKSWLNQHMLTHKERMYACNLCQKAFRRINHLKLHHRTHTGEKPYSCPICNRAFAYRGDMVKHYRNHVVHNKHSPAESQSIESIIENDNTALVESRERIPPAETVQNNNMINPGILLSLLNT